MISFAWPASRLEHPKVDAENTQPTIQELVLGCSFFVTPTHYITSSIPPIIKDIPSINTPTNNQHQQLKQPPL
jgi:hypothetical protein